MGNKCLLSNLSKLPIQPQYYFEVQPRKMFSRSAMLMLSSSTKSPLKRPKKDLKKPAKFIFCQFY